ncbi:MAG TPA: SIS domain-containing protein [bacterium]|nr:SIS domain-containing protein [bacterium]
MISTPTKPIPANYEAALRTVVAQAPDVESFARRVGERGLRNVFLVGSGGSLAGFYQLQFILDQGGRGLSTYLMSSGEFNVRRPVNLGPDSLMVVVSHRGQTPETVEAARIARRAGASVLAITRDADSLLAGVADDRFVYERDEVVVDAKLILLAILGTSLVDQAGAAPDPVGVRRAFNALPAALVSAMREREDANRATAERLKDEPIIYVLASGPSYGIAYSFAMCTLQEAQWMHAAAYNAAEFFHGAFEVIDENVAVIVLLDESEARPLAERACSFVQRYSKKVTTIDTRDLLLPGIETPQRALISPIALGTVMFRLTAHFAAVRGRSYADRRYMFKVPY